MKAKVFGKKLALQKTTVSNLGGNEMDYLCGGATEEVGCGTYQKTVCFTICETDCAECYLLTIRTCPP